MPPRDLLDEAIDEAEDVFRKAEKGDHAATQVLGTMLIADQLRALRRDERRVWAMFAARALAMRGVNVLTGGGYILDAAADADALLAEYRKRFPTEGE